MFQDIGITNSWCKCVKKIIKFFKVSNQYSIGVYIAEDRITCVQINRLSDNTYNITFADSFTIDSEDEKTIGEVMEELENTLNKEGIYNRIGILYVDENEVYCYKRNLHEFDDKNISEAVHWEVASNDPFAGDYIEGYNCVGEKVFIGAVCRNDVVIYSNCFKKAGIDIFTAVTSTRNVEFEKYGENISIEGVDIHVSQDINWDDENRGMIYSLYAALSGIQELEYNIKFWLKNKILVDWYWNRIAICILCVTFILSSIVVGKYMYKEYDVDTELNQQSEALYLLSDVLESKQRADVIATEIERRGILLKDLSKDSWPLYAILVHLGCINCDGVWLTDLSTDKAVGITLKGEAISYNSLVKYYQALEADNDFFAGEKVMEKSDLQDNGNIVFQIKANLK